MMGGRVFHAIVLEERVVHACSPHVWPPAHSRGALQELTLAGNMLTQLPDRIGNLTHLQKLQLSGNRLTQLPDSISSLSRLEVCLP